MTTRVDPHAAPKCVSCGHEVYFDETEEREGRPVNGGNPAAHAIVTLINSLTAYAAANAMRSACVAKVSGLSIEFEFDGQLESAYSFRDRVVAALESLTLDQQQEKQL